jgi:hypothetical protein
MARPTRGLCTSQSSSTHPRAGPWAQPPPSSRPTTLVRFAARPAIASNRRATRTPWYIPSPGSPAPVLSSGTPVDRKSRLRVIPDSASLPAAPSTDLALLGSHQNFRTPHAAPPDPTPQRPPTLGRTEHPHVIFRTPTRTRGRTTITNNIAPPTTITWTSPPPRLPTPHAPPGTPNPPSDTCYNTGHSTHNQRDCMTEPSTITHTFGDSGQSGAIPNPAPVHPSQPWTVIASAAGLVLAQSPDGYAVSDRNILYGR